jgi:protein CWC15
LLTKFSLYCYDEDDTAALLAELDRIKKERAEEAQRREAEAQENEAMEKAEELASGNPLLNLRGGGLCASRIQL